MLQPSELAAATAASYGVPIIMASGDDILCADIARQLGPQVETACTKTALSFHAASCLLPAEALAEVRGAAERSIRRLLKQQQQVRSHWVSAGVAHIASRRTILQAGSGIAGEASAGKFCFPVPGEPITVDISMKNYRPVEMLGLLPTIERLVSSSI